MTFASLIVGALGGEPRQAAPIAELSVLWRAGVDLLDDLRAGRTNSAASCEMVTAIARLTRLPHKVICSSNAPASIREHWRRTFTEASVAALSGKTGALVAAEAVMAARLVTDCPHELLRWHTFGLAVGNGLLTYARNMLVELAEPSYFRDLLLAYHLQGSPGSHFFCE